MLEKILSLKDTKTQIEKMNLRRDPNQMNLTTNSEVQPPEGLTCMHPPLLSQQQPWTLGGGGGSMRNLPRPEKSSALTRQMEAAPS